MINKRIPNSNFLLFENCKNAEHPVIYFNLFLHFFERKKSLLSWAVNASFNRISELNVLCILGNCRNAQIVYRAVIFCQIEELVWNTNMTNLILVSFIIYLYSNYWRHQVSLQNKSITNNKSIGWTFSNVKVLVE